MIGLDLDDDDHEGTYNIIATTTSSYNWQTKKKNICLTIDTEFKLLKPY